MKNKICVIGAGNWGINHIKTLSKLNSLGGIVEIDNIKLKEIKNQYPDTKTFNKVEDAINYGFNGFVVCSPAEDHYRTAVKILNKACPVLIEKPLTTKLSEAKKINNLAKSKKVILMVGHLLLFHPAFLKMKEMIDNDIIGSLQYMYSNRLNFGRVRTKENVLWSLAPHDIALFQFFLNNQKPTNIDCSGNDMLQKGIHDSSITQIEYNKIMTHIFVSWLHPFKEHRFVIIGSKGMISFEDSYKDKPLVLYDKKVVWKNNIPLLNKGNAQIINYNDNLALENELNYFIKHLNSPVIKKANGDSAVEVMEILTSASKKLLRN